MAAKAKVRHQKQIFKEGILIDRAEVSLQQKKIKRYRVNRPDASAMLLHDKEKKRIILVKQFRYAIHDKIKENIYEIPAGKVDPGEDPLETAVRETYEECGYKLKPAKLKKIAEFFAAPGYTTEKFHLYYASVGRKDKTDQGGGLEEENEFIDILEVPEEKFIRMLKKGKIEDAKTLVAAQWFLLNKYR